MIFPNKNGTLSKGVVRSAGFSARINIFTHGFMRETVRFASGVVLDKRTAALPSPPLSLETSSPVIQPNSSNERRKETERKVVGGREERERGRGERERMKRGGTSRAISRNRSHSGWSPVWLMTARAPITNKYSPDRAGLLHYVLISDEHRPRVLPASAAADPRWVLGC